MSNITLHRHMNVVVHAHGEKINATVITPYGDDGVVVAPSEDFQEYGKQLTVESDSVISIQFEGLWRPVEFHSYKHNADGWYETKD